MFHETRERWKIWIKTDLWFGKLHDEFEKISPEHTKVSNLGLLLGPFMQILMCHDNEER